MQRLLTLIISIFTVAAMQAQLNGFNRRPAVAKCSSRIEMTDANSGKLIITVTPSKGWHIYGFDIEAGGPKAMTLDLSKSAGVKFKGDVIPSVKPLKVYDDMFAMDVEYWEGTVTLTRKFEVEKGTAPVISGVLTYQGCNDATCSSPQKFEFSHKLP